MKPERVRDMAREIHKAKRGGWYISTGLYIVYASHSWAMIKTWVRSQPILIKRRDEE